MSDTSFITEDAMSSLGLEDLPVNLSLSTLSNENELVHTSKVSGLHVTGYKSDKGLNLGLSFLDCLFRLIGVISPPLIKSSIGRIYSSYVVSCHLS